MYDTHDEKSTSSPDNSKNKIHPLIPKKLSEIESIDDGQENIIVKHLPFLQWQSSTIISAAPSAGKTTAAYLIIRDALRADKDAQVLWLTEVYAETIRQLKAILPEQLPDRVMVERVGKANSNYLKHVNTVLRYEAKLIIVVDTLMAWLSALSIRMNSNDETSKAIGYLRTLMEQSLPFELCWLILHHTRKPQAGETVTSDPMGATAIRAQINTRVSLLPHKKDKVVNLQWESQTTDPDSVAFKYTAETKSSNSKTVYTDWQATKALSADASKDLDDREDQATLFAYFALCHEHNKPPKPTPARSSLGWYYPKVKRMLSQLVESGDLIKEGSTYKTSDGDGETLIKQYRQCLRLPPASYCFEDEKLMCNYDTH